MNRQTSTLAVAVVGALIISSALAAEPEATMPRPMGQGMNQEMNHACGLPMGDGVIKSMDVGESKVSIAYEPIKALDWDKGTKKFAVTRPVDLTAFTSGERVRFMLRSDRKGSYSIAALCSLDADAVMHDACMDQMHETAMKMADEADRPCAMDHMGHMDDAGRKGRMDGAMDNMKHGDHD